MSRRVRLLAFALLASFALSASACASITGPRSDCTSGHQGSGTCADSGHQGSGT